MLAQDKYGWSGIIWKWQLQLNLSVLVRRYKIPGDHPAASVHAMYWLTLFVLCHNHVVHMLEKSVISLRILLANLNFDMNMNSSSCIFKFIWLGIWWLEVYRMTTTHMVRLHAHVNNLKYHMIAIGKWQFHTLRPRQSGRQFSDDISNAFSSKKSLNFD